jgi:hypothetical protein
MNPISIQSSISQNEFVKFWVVKFFSSKQTIFAYSLMLIVTFMSIFQFLPSFFITLSILIFILLPAFLSFKAIKSFKKNDILSKPMSFTFYDTKIHLLSDDLNKELPYSQISKIEFTKNFVMIYLSQESALMLNKANLKDQENELILLLNSVEGLKLIL